MPESLFIAALKQKVERLTKCNLRQNKLLRELVFLKRLENRTLFIR